MAFDRKKIIRFFTWKRLLIPIMIGLVVAVWMNMDNFHSKSLHDFFSGLPSLAFVCFTVALLLQALRDFFYMVRIRILTDKQLGWRQSFEVIMLWEFASALTPSVVGGSAVAFFIIAQEGISLGRSTAIVLITAFLDEMFYLIMVPIVIMIVGFDGLIAGRNISLFFIGYGFIFVLNSVIAYGIFINPKGLKKILVGIFSIRPLRKWRLKAIQTGNDIVITSKEMRKRSFSFWVKSFSITFLSWTVRFLVINLLIIAVGGYQHQWLIYAKQLVMWIILMISPTPGGNGVAEVLFKDFLKPFIPIIEGVDVPSILAVVWRFLSCYSYYVIGLIVFPLWLRRVFSRKHLKKIQGKI